MIVFSRNYSGQGEYKLEMAMTNYWAVFDDCVGKEVSMLSTANSKGRSLIYQLVLLAVVIFALQVITSFGTQQAYAEQYE